MWQPQLVLLVTESLGPVVDGAVVVGPSQRTNRGERDRWVLHHGKEISSMVGDMLSAKEVRVAVLGFSEVGVSVIGLRVVGIGVVTVGK